MTAVPFPPENPDDVDEHPEVAEISALGEGLLPPQRAARVRAHLGACALCADVQSSLAEIHHGLTTLPSPPRMPEDIAARIDAALAAEPPPGAPAPAEATSEPEVDAERHSGAAPDSAPSNEPVSRETDREAGSANASKVPADSTETIAPVEESATAPPHRGTTASPVSRETGSRPHPGSERPPGHPRGSTGPGRSGTRRRNRRRTLLTAVGAFTLLGLGGALVPWFASSSSKPDRATAQRGAETSGERGVSTADEAQLERRVDALLSGNSPKISDSPPVDTKKSPEESAPANDPKSAPAAPQCVLDGTGRTESPIAVDEKAPYEAGTGYLLVLPHSNGDSQRVDVYLVDPSCASGGPGEPGKVLVKRTYDRR